MTIQQHASFDSSAAELNATSKLVKAWESKNAKNAAKAGGVSLMALSLAACGGSSDTVDITSDNAAAIATALTDANGTLHADVAAAIASGVDSVDITTDNAAAITGALTGADGTVYADVAAAVAAGVTSVDITSDNAAAITGALTGADGTVYADVAAAVAAGVTSVDITTDNATAATTALRNAAAELGVTGTSVMTDAELITAIKTANDTAIANGVDLTTDNAAAIDAAVVALGLTGISTLAQLNAAYDELLNPTVTSFTLTNAANQITGGADNLTGSASNDTFLAFADQALDSGDVIDGGDGVDTLTARYVIDGDTTVAPSVVNVENVIIETDEGAAGDHELNFNASMTGLSEIRVRNAEATDAAGTDDINITSIALGVDVAIENGDGVFDVDFQYASVTGSTDAATLKVAAADAETVTIAGIETLTINAESGASAIATLTATAATTVNVTGSGGLTVTNIDDATTTFNASTSTGAMSIAGAGDVDMAITAGSGGMTADLSGTTVDNNDSFTGGAGTDRLIVDADETAALTGLSGVEEVEIDVADIDEANGGADDGAGTVALSGAISADVTSFLVDVTTATDGDVGTVTISSLDNGDVITILDGGSDTDGAGAAAGISLATTLATNSDSDTLTIGFSGIGAVSDDSSDTTGYAQVEADEVETLTIASNANAAGDVSTNGVEVLTVQAATGLVFNGAADFAASSLVNTTLLTSINASAMTGDLTLTGIDASVLTLTDGAGDLTVTIAGLNNADSIDGGDQDTATGDTVTASAVTGLTAATGALDVSNVETLNIQATGANTFDLSNVDNVGVFAISGATPGTQTLTNVAAGQVLSLGDAADEFDNGAELDVTLADATGSADALTINVNNTGGAQTDAALDISGVETITLDVSAATNNAAVAVANAEATTLNVVDGGAGAVLALGNLNAATSVVNLVDYDGEVTFSGANVTSAMTVTASSSAAADDFTLSDQNDTATVGSTGAVDVDIDGGAGTADILNLTVTTGFVDTGEIDNFETINFTVAAGVDIAIGANGAAATDANAIAEATSVTIAGGNSLSTFEVGDSDAASADNITAAVDIDASTFQGNVFLEYAADVFTGTTDVSAGALATDQVTALFDTTATDVTLPLSGVDTFTASLNSAGYCCGKGAVHVRYRRRCWSNHSCCGCG